LTNSTKNYLCNSLKDQWFGRRCSSSDRCLLRPKWSLAEWQGCIRQRSIDGFSDITDWSMVSPYRRHPWCGNRAESISTTFALWWPLKEESLIKGEWVG
jgi:hypothetical protein